MNDKELQQAFLQFLAKKSGAKSQLELEKYVQSLGEDGLKQAYDEFTKVMLSQAQKAAHGAKLQYFRNLKHKCGENEELVFYKKGGSVECGCVGKKMEKGGEAPKSRNAVNEFKTKKMQSGSRMMQLAEANKERKKKEAGKKALERKWKEGEIIVGKDIQRGQKDAGPQAKVQDNAVPNEDIPSHDKKKKEKCGGKVNKHSDGGSLNGIPFIQKGTPKGGLPTAPKAKDRFKNGVRDSVAYLGVPGKDESYFGESIRRVTTPDNAKIQLLVLFRHYPNNNDTIYTEVPEHKERLLFLPPVNIKSRKAFNYIKGPEYEILKRRFNTAWNLAK